MPQVEINFLFGEFLLGFEGMSSQHSFVWFPQLKVALEISEGNGLLYSPIALSYLKTK